MVSGQTKYSENITPAEGYKIFTRNSNYVTLLNTFFSNLVKDLKIPGFKGVSHFAEVISDLIPVSVSADDS